MNSLISFPTAHGQSLNLNLSRTMRLAARTAFATPPGPLARKDSTDSASAVAPMLSSAGSAAAGLGGRGGGRLSGVGAGGAGIASSSSRRGRSGGWGDHISRQVFARVEQ